MFMCRTCTEDYEWPNRLYNSYGNCEFCGKLRMCFDVPTALNLRPKKIKPQLDIDSIT